MSIRQGNKVLSAGQSLTQNLFDFKWADHILDDIQWLRADTFTWHDGRVYEAAYQHLLAEWNEVGDVPSTEIVAGTQIYYRLAPDGHKICSASQEDEAVAIYEATGIAWYYILDTTNQRFKLPRTKFGFVGLRDNDVGKYVAPGLPEVPDHTHPEEWPFSNDYVRTISPTVGATQTTGSTKSLTNTTPHVSYEDDGYITTGGASIRTSNIYGASTTVQSPATQMYLYFFVGNFAQSAVVNTAGINATLVNEIQNECIDLQNNKQDTATAVNYNNISNCITEIPQDIKLEISGGGVKLKAGSKVWYPNGPNVFSSLTASSDIYISPTGGSGKCLICVNVTNDVIQAGSSNATGNCVSGPGVEHRDYGMCYDTTTNIIQRWGDPGVLNAAKASFPLALVTQTDGAITSIDQVFNGIGYIGQSAFSLPGIKGLIPNGRNTDGTLKNTEFTTTNVYVGVTFTNGYTVNNQLVAINSTGILWQNWIGEYDHEPAVVQYAAYYNSTTNKIYFAYSATEWTEISRAAAGFFSTTTGGTFTELKTRQPFYAVDYSDTEYIAHQAMPSDKYIDFTLGASGATYTAPADGWVDVQTNASTNSQGWVSANIDAKGISCGLDIDRTGIGKVLVPVSKNDIVKVTFGGTTLNFVKFIYANGAK